MSDFDLIQTVLRELPDTQRLTTPLEDRSCEQLRRAVFSLANDQHAVGPGDLAVLVRHVLRRATLRSDPEYLLTVPSSAPWPDEKLWAASHVQVVGSDQNSRRLRSPSGWSADWLPHSREYEPFKASYLEESRRKGWPTSPP